MNDRIRRMSDKLKRDLDESRYRHTLGVMYTAAALAMCHGADLEKAMTAGLLHDCAKCIPNNRKLELCREHGIQVSEAERGNPSLLHAKLGAHIARVKYQVKDEEVLRAIASHTTGRPGMSLLEKIVYIADYMEPGRAPLPNMEEVRRTSFADIDASLLRILKDSLAYLQTRGMVIDPATEETYEYYKEYLNKQED